MLFRAEILKNTAFQIVARIVSSGSSLLITLIILRHFGIVGYGDFAKVTAFVTLFYLLADFGFNAVFLQHDDSKIHFRDLFYSRLLISVFVILLLNSLAYLLPYNPITSTGFSPAVRIGILIYSFTVITESILFTSSAVFQRELSYEMFMLSSMVGGVVSVAAVAVLVLFGVPLPFILWAFVVAGIAESGVALLLTDEVLLPIRIDRIFMRHLARETFPVTLLLVFNLIYFRIDMILLAFLKTAKDVGVYDLSYRGFDFLIALPLFLSNSLYPQILADLKNSRTVPLAKKYVAMFVLAALVIIIPAWFLPYILGIIHPSFYTTAVPFHMLLLSLPVFFGTNILQWLLIAQKQQRFLALVYFASTILNIALNVVFIPRYSYVASAIITGVCEGIVLLILWVKLFGKKESALEKLMEK